MKAACESEKNPDFFSSIIATISSQNPLQPWKDSLSLLATFRKEMAKPWEAHDPSALPFPTKLHWRGRREL